MSLTELLTCLQRQIWLASRAAIKVSINKGKPGVTVCDKMIQSRFATCKQCQFCETAKEMTEYFWDSLDQWNNVTWLQRAQLGAGSD